MPGLPTKIGKYDVLREIGRGGMGKVYCAVDPTIGRMVAIKQVTAVVSDDPDLLKRFYREAQSTGKLQHPNIVTLHDLGEQDGVPYLVMEYLEGDSLEKIIHEKRPYTVAEKLNIIIQVCEGLAYAHQRQITHRDIKPGNIVVLNDGGVKIVDFGIAQFGNERYTRTGQVVGSLYYMSPEQIQDADIDSRSDIYSTGIVLYEFLTGSVPFRGKDPASTLAKILHDNPPSLAQAFGLYGPDLDDVVRRALSKDRNVRYGSMEDFAFDLRTLEEKLSRDLIDNSLRSAESCMAAREYEKAKDYLRQVLKLDKQHRRANELLREVQSQIQRQLIGEQVRQLRQRADEALGLRNWDEALAALDQAIKLDGGNTELIRFRDSVRHSSSIITEALRRAESAHTSGDLDGAKRAVEEALAVDPYNTTAKALNAILSKEISERAKRKKVDDFVLGARKEIALRHFTAALELLRGAEAVDPSLGEVQQLIRSATAGRELERRRQALERACSEIEELLNQDQYSAACEKADEALKTFPQDLGLLKLKGFAERQRDAWTRRQFIEDQTASARQLVDSGELVRAQNLLNEALERYPDDTVVISLLEIVTDAIARQEAQRREAERQANERRRYIRVQLQIAADLQQSGRIAEALKKIREGLEQYPDSEEFRSRVIALEDALAQEEIRRRKGEDEARQKRAEIEKTIAESWQLLSAKQTGQAVVLLDQALRRHPDNADLKSQLEFAQRRLAVAQAERERAEQEARRKLAEIRKELSSAQQLLDYKQTDQAATALQKAVERFPENEELRSLLQAALQRLAAEQAQREVAEKELRQLRSAIESEISASRELLESRRTSDSIARLEKALQKYPENEELKAALAYARQRFTEEEAARKKAAEEERRRRAWIDAEISNTRQWLNEKQADRAVTSLLQALRQFPDDQQLRTQLEFAQNRLAQQKADQEKAEQEARLRQAEIDREVANAWELLDAQRTDQAVVNLEKAVQRFPESKELRSQFELAKNRFEAEEAERERIAEEERRKAEEISQEIRSARQFLQAKQTDRAVARLELATQRYADNSDLKAELAQARERLAEENAERARIAEQHQRQQEEIKKAGAAALVYLESGRVAEAIAGLEEALRRIPDSSELRSQLQRAKDLLAREEAAKRKAEEEKQRRQREIANSVSMANKLTESGQTGQAVSTLERALGRFPDSSELQTQLAAANARLAKEQAERTRIEQEEKRKRAEIEKERNFAQDLLDSKKTVDAVSALEASVAKFSDSVELRNLLDTARQRFSHEQQEKLRLEQERDRRRAEIAAAVAAATGLLEAKQTAQAVSTLQQAARKFPESQEIGSLLASAQQTLEQEKAANEKAAREAEARRQEIAAAVERERLEKQKAQLASAREKIQSLINGGNPENAVSAADAFLRSLGKNPELLQLLEAAKAAVKKKNEEEKKRAAERQFAEQREKQRKRDLLELRTLAESITTTSKLSIAEKTRRKAVEIASRYHDDTEIQQTLERLQTAVESIRSGSAKPNLEEAGSATKIFQPRGAEAPRTMPQAETPARAVSGPAVAPHRSAFVNKWTAIAAVALVAAGIGLKYAFAPKTKPNPATFVVTIETTPAGASVQVGDQRCVTPKCRVNLAPGQYVVQAQLEGYQDFSQSLTVDPSAPPSPLSLALTPTRVAANAGYLVVRAGVEGAEVLVNGTKLSRTGAGGTVRVPLDPGSYRVEIQKPGYQVAKIPSVQIRKGQDTPEDFKLVALPTASELVITAAVPNAQVLEDGHYLGLVASDGSFSQSIDPGKHDILLELDGRKSNTLSQTFIAGKPSGMDGRQFVISRPPAAIATLTINRLPAGASVSVDGKTYHPDSLGTVHLEFPAGERTLSIAADNYKPKQIHQSFAAGNVSLDGSLEAIDLEAPEWTNLNKNDMAALQGFLNRFPSGNNAKQASAKLDQLIAANTSEPELRGFHDKFPNTVAGAAAAKRADSLRGDVDRKNQERADRQGIQSLLDQYRSAYEQRDLSTLVRVYPNWSAAAQKATQTKFKNAVSLKVTLNAETPTLSGDQASLKVTQTLNWTQKDGSQSSEVTPALVWQLAKKDGHWLIQKGP